MAHSMTIGLNHTKKLLSIFWLDKFCEEAIITVKVGNSDYNQNRTERNPFP